MAGPNIKRGDRFTWTYALWFLPVLVQPWEGWFPAGWDWLGIDFLAFLLLAIAIVVSLCINSIRRRWRRVLSLLVTPVFLLIPIVLLAIAGITPNSIRFALTRNGYLAEIQRSDAQSTEPRFNTFVWDDTFTAKTYVTLVYDESDEIVLPIGNQSEAWRQRIQKTCAKNRDCVNLDPQPDEYISVTKIGDHFYLLNESFPNAFP
ncbi:MULTISPECIES: hypothetical protein [Rhizobium]|uniref:hypothetical protein n=1 Tax=Rhizobium TaxID=379 RepID=UPI0019590471|nr:MULTISPECIES: hypothetical protein [Rhizobium]MBM7048728.1 hypothetical protein [Rhizobium lusitanum]